MKTITVKNFDTGNHTWGGLEFTPEMEYTLEEGDIVRFSSDNVFFTDVGTGKGKIGDGSVYFDAIAGWSWLIGNTPGEVVLTGGTLLTYDDIGVANGGVARGTTITPAMEWVQLYSYTGTGTFMGFKLTLEDFAGTATNYWRVRLQVDGNEIFDGEIDGLSGYDMSSNNVYNWNTGTTPSPTWVGINLIQNTLSFESLSNLPITFKTNVKILASRIGTINKIFRAGLVGIIKES